MSSWEVARAARDRCLLWLCKSRWATGITQTTVASCRAGGGGTQITTRSHPWQQLFPEAREIAAVTGAEAMERAGGAGENRRKGAQH